MKEIEKPSSRQIVAGSLAVIIFLAMERKQKSDMIEIIGFLAILVLAYCVVQIWIRYIKEYVEFAIEQKSKKVDREIKSQ